MTETSTRTPSTSEPLVDLQRIMVSIRRRRRLWVSVALLGLIAGALLAFLMPPKPTAIARLLIVHESDQPSDTGTLMRTDVALLETARIAAAALDKLGSTQRPEDFLTEYDARGLTSNVLELEVQGPDDQEAVARATALSEVFIADYVQRIQAGADAEAKALVDQRVRAEKELAEVDAAIAGMPARPNAEDSARLETLYSRRAELGSQVSDLGRRAEEAGIGAPRVAAGTQIVDAPRAVPRSMLRTGVTNAGIGLVVGLVVGLALAAVLSVVRDRPVLRREIAAHLGASVIAQLPGPRRGPARLWRRSRATAERKRVAATLVRAVRDDAGTVSLLEIGCPKTAAALAMDIAGSLAATSPIVVIDDLPEQNVRKLSTDTEGPIRVFASADVLPLPVSPARRRHLGVGSVGPGTAWTDLSQLGPETVLVVRAGHANTAWLHTVARQLADLGVPIIGVVLVAPDPKDRSDGTLWDGLHTALRGRAKRAAKASNGTAKVGVGTRLDLPTERFAPVKTLSTENGDGQHDVATERFAPVKPTASDNGEVP